METNPETGDGTEEVVDASETVEELDITTAGIDELLAEHSSLGEEVTALRELPQTIANDAELAAAIERKNAVTKAINVLRTHTAPTEEPLAEAKSEADVEPEAAADNEEVVEPETAEVVSEAAPAVDAVAGDTPASPVDAGTSMDQTSEPVAAEAATPEVPAPASDAVEEAPAAPTVAVSEEAPQIAPDAEAPVATELAAETETETAPAASEAVTPEGEPATTHDVINDTATSTTEVTTVETPLNPTGDSPQPSAESAVVEAAQTILETGELVGAHVASAGAPARPSGPPAHPTRPTVQYEAGGGQTKFSQGRPLSFAEIGEAMNSIKTRRATPGSGPVDGIIASIPAFEDAGDALGVDVLNKGKTPEQNSALMRESADNFQMKRAGREPRVAAICDPLDILRDIPQCGETDTPFADSFPQRPIARLGFQYIPGMSAAAVDDGVAIWSEQDQLDIVDDDSSTWKPVVDITCADPIEAKAEEITVGARVDTSTSMSQPEHVEEFIHKLRVQRARRREQYLLGKFDGLAGGYTFEANYGAVAGLIEAVGSLMPSLVYGERLDQGDYDLVLEPGHREKLVIDETSRVFGDNERERWINIQAMLKDLLGVGKITLLRDFKGASNFHAVRANGTSGALTRLRDVNRVRLLPASAFLYGATGEEATGWQTDPQLVRQNRTQFFSTEWILLAKHGCHPAAWVDLTSCGNGSRAAGIEPVDCTTQGS